MRRRLVCLVTIYEDKGDIQECENHRGKNLEVTVWRHMRVRRKTKVNKNEFGFMPRLSMELIFGVRHIVEMYAELRRKFFMIFINVEKAYDRVFLIFCHLQ